MNNLIAIPDILVTLCDDLQIPKIDLSYALRRAENEGLFFLQEALPKLYGELLCWLEMGRIPQEAKQKLQSFKFSGNVPAFLKTFFLGIFDENGLLRKHPDASSFATISQVTRYFRRMDLNSELRSEKLHDESVQSFIKTQTEVYENFNPDVWNSLRKVFHSAFPQLITWEPSAKASRFGPGSPSTFIEEATDYDRSLHSAELKRRGFFSDALSRPNPWYLSPFKDGNNQGAFRGSRPGYHALRRSRSYVAGRLHGKTGFFEKSQATVSTECESRAGGFQPSSACKPYPVSQGQCPEVFNLASSYHPGFDCLPDDWDHAPLIRASKPVRLPLPGESRRSIDVRHAEVNKLLRSRDPRSRYAKSALARYYPLCCDFITVPKTASKRRPICKEPIALLAKQMAFHYGLRQVLERTTGFCYFTDKTPNNLLARLGSITGSMATIDFSDASLTISWMGLTTLFCETKILDYLLMCRSPFVRLRDSQFEYIMRYTSAAGTGSGIAFPSMEVALACAAIKVQLDCGRSLNDILTDPGFAIYGDDVVIASSFAAPFST